MAQMRIRLNRLKSGMIIKDNIYSRTGTFLIGAGTVATPDIISLLTKHLIEYSMLMLSMIYWHTGNHKQV